MAEFCVKCFEKMNDLKPRPVWTYQLDFDLCESCGEWRADIVSGLHAGAVMQIIQFCSVLKKLKRPEH